MQFLIGLALKSLLIAGATLGALYFLRGRSPSQRSVFAHLGLLTLIILPFGAILLPAVPLHVPIFHTARSQPVLPQTAQDYNLATVAPATEFDQPTTPLSRSRWCLLFGVPTVVLLAATVLAVFRLLALRTKASVLVEPTWLLAMAHAQRRMRFKHGTALLSSAHLNSPISWGLFRPVILLNESALPAASEAEAIIAHELAHIRSSDWAKLLLGRLVTAIFWFNPLVWALAREAHQLREEAADDAVICANVANAEYARLLVGIARHDCKHLLLSAHGVAPSRGSLARRIQRVLDKTSSRTPMGKSLSAIVAVAIVAVATPLAALTLELRTSGAQVKATPPLDLTRAESTPTARANTRAPDVVRYSALRLSRVRRDEAAEAALTTSFDVGAIAKTYSKTEWASAPREAQRTPRSAKGYIGSSGDIETIDSAFQAKDRKVSAAYAAEVRSAFPGIQITDLSVKDLHAVGASSNWLQAMKEVGFENAAVEDFIDARAVGLDPRYVVEMASAGLRNASLKDLVVMRATGITATSIRRVRSHGHKMSRPTSFDEAGTDKGPAGRPDLISKRFKSSTLPIPPQTLSASKPPLRSAREFVGDN